MIVPWRPEFEGGLEVLNRALMFIKGLNPAMIQANGCATSSKEPPRVERQYVNLVLGRSVT